MLNGWDRLRGAGNHDPRKNADEAYEGCPVVPVYDTPVEFAHLLRVLIPKETRT